MLSGKDGKACYIIKLVVDGPGLKKAICGSTNLSWRGFIQNNNAIVLTGANPVAKFQEAFEKPWTAGEKNNVKFFSGTKSPTWQSLGLNNIDTWKLRIPSQWYKHSTGIC